MLWLVVMRQIICNNKVDFLNLKNPWNQNYYPSSLLRIKTFVLQPNINSFHVSSVQFLELAYSVQFLVLAYSFLFLELVQFLELAYLHEGGRMSCGYFLVVLNRVTVCSVLVSNFITFQQVLLYLKLSSLVFVWFRFHLFIQTICGDWISILIFLLSDNLLSWVCFAVAIFLT